MDYNFFMGEALAEAKKAFAEGEVPIGAVVVKDGKIIGRGRNQRESLNDPTAHAEILALRDAGKTLRTWRLTGAYLFVTIEPCPMCAGAMLNSRIEGLVYGADEPKFGSAGSQLNILQYPGFNHNVKIIGPIMEAECKQLMKDFFKKLRKGKKISDL